ncbi:hypothetical protein VKT23_017806, partial [Stygiomarasmius scandens]
IRYTFHWHNGKPKEDTMPNTLLALLIKTGLISITEDEIMDRSKSDPFAKIVVLCQTLWFIVQSVARGVEGLSITDLEILTNAFAMLNFVTYFLWWNKPQHVRFPIVIDASKMEEGSLLEESAQDTEAAGMADPSLIQSGTEAAETWENLTLIQSIVEQQEQSTMEARKTEDLEVRRENDYGVTQETPNHQNHSDPMGTGRRIRCALKAIGEEIEDDWKSMQPVFDDIHIPQWFIVRAFLYPFLAIFFQLGCLVGGFVYYQTGTNEIGKDVLVPVVCITVVFGGIHCIPWAFQFPSHTEQILWHVCALSVTCIPIGTTLVVALGVVMDLEHTLLAILAIAVLPILYIVARIILVVLALMELRALPSSAYQTVEWTNLIPHI